MIPACAAHSAQCEVWQIVTPSSSRAMKARPRAKQVASQKLIAASTTTSAVCCRRWPSLRMIRAAVDGRPRRGGGGGDPRRRLAVKAGEDVGERWSAASAWATASLCNGWPSSQALPPLGPDEDVFEGCRCGGRARCDAASASSSTRMERRRCRRMKATRCCVVGSAPPSTPPFLRDGALPSPGELAVAPPQRRGTPCSAASNGSGQLGRDQPSPGLMQSDTVRILRRRLGNHNSVRRAAWPRGDLWPPLGLVRRTRSRRFTAAIRSRRRWRCATCRVD